MTIAEIQDIVARTMNILERDYGADDLLDMGMPTVREITATIAKAYAPILADRIEDPELRAAYLRGAERAATMLEP